ncbi:MAG: hypothetical protein ACLPUT_12840 [Solirubrobacteraceae bacterium]
MSTTTTALPPHAAEATPLQPGAGTRRTRSLGSYIALDTQQTREVVSLQRPDGSTLVVDYQLGTLSDGRLVAHLAPDEPPENAQIVCELYLADDTKGRCRAVTREDFDLTRHATPPPSGADAPTAVDAVKDADGHVYRIRELPTLETMGELRWTRSREPGREFGFNAVSFRDVVAAVEAYEPARTITTQALTRCARNLSTRRLREEYERLMGSPIVLNRGLREAVQRELRLGVLSMSEIALRCGRVKRDTRGNVSGETSWLARRIGQMPEGGEQKPGPWIHSDVLALVARDGLGVCPREVEL